MYLFTNSQWPERLKPDGCDCQSVKSICKIWGLLLPYILIGVLLPLVARAWTDVSIDAYSPNKQYHAIGARQGESAWGAASGLGPGFLTYGPYSSDFANGSFEVRYRLSVDNSSADDMAIAYVDVYDSVAKKELARREIHRREFTHADSFEDFPLSFDTFEASKLEFRVFVLGKAFVTHASTTVIRKSTYADAVLHSNQASTGEQLPAVGVALRSIKTEIEQGNTHSVEWSPPTAGNYVARFSLSIDKKPLVDQVTATCDVYNKMTDSVLAATDVKLNDFREPRSTQIFELPFEYDGVGQLEFRTSNRAAVHVQRASTEISPSHAFSYAATDATVTHQLGSAAHGFWLAKKSDGPGYLSLGPYTRSVPSGVATVTFTLSASQVDQTREAVALLDVYDDVTGRVLAKRLVMSTDFQGAGLLQDFDLVFEVERPTSLEFRVFTYGFVQLQHRATMVTPDRLTLAALWNSQAHWEYRKRDVFTSKGLQDYYTSTLISLDGIWFAFNRVASKGLSASQLESCMKNGAPPLQVVARRSEDHGITWSEPVVIAMSSSSTAAPDFCAVVDGSAYFDAETDVWHYLAQCINQSSGWNLCHYTRAGSSPMGQFIADPANPVIVGGQLWGKICEGPAKSCAATTKDEGTPQILSKNSNGFFYVTFHGANYGAIVTGARGVARTADFVNWQVTAKDLPGDAMLTASDCEHWNVSWAGGCIGEGDARILRSNGANYMLAEAADKSLTCQTGQTWAFGLLRNPVLGASGSWENYGGNPIIVNENYSPGGCAIQYMNFVRDRGELFLEFSLYSSDIAFPSYVYQLVGGPPPARSMLVH